jgi:regulator of sigma E protease
MQYLTTENLLFIPIFLIVISVLVAAHEYGHYIFARMFGMGVEEFAIGFGRKPLWTYKRKKYLIPITSGEVVRDHPESSATDGFGFESKDRKMIRAVVVDTPQGQAVEETTNFTIRPWPLGGFVRIKGMLPEDDGSETKIPGGFYSKEPWKRFIVLLAGPVFSVIAGSILIFILFATVGARDLDKNPIVGKIKEGYPAAAAGLQVGDRIVSINGEPVKSPYDIVSRVRYAAGKSQDVRYERDGKFLTTSLVPVLNSEETDVLGPGYKVTGKKARQAVMGIEWNTVYVPMPISQAALAATLAPVRAVIIMGQLMKTPAKLKENVGGPITMLRETHNAISAGPPDIIGFAAMLSISVGIFNLLPIPPLDGGQMAIAVAEMFRRGRRLSMRVQNMAAAAGMVMVLLLVVVVFTIDIQRLGQANKSNSAKPKVEKPATQAK